LAVWADFELDWADKNSCLCYNIFLKNLIHPVTDTYFTFCVNDFEAVDDSARLKMLLEEVALTSERALADLFSN